MQLQEVSAAIPVSKTVRRLVLVDPTSATGAGVNTPALVNAFSSGSICS